MSNIKTTVLKNGLRVVTDHVPGMHSIALGVWIGVGTRHEDLTYNGVAHMVEHMMFKGTEMRTALEIAEVIETVGGQMNAYTSRDMTSYHIHLLENDMSLALNVLADLTQNSVMPQDELERERHVILQEIGMCHDTPDDVVFDYFTECAYPRQAFGAPILGTNEIVSTLSRETLMGFVEQLYRPHHMVVSAAGAVDHDAFVVQVEKEFGGALASDVEVPYEAARYEGGEFRLEKDLEQSHLILGFQGVPRADDDFYAAQALAIILGGGMASRLFQEVREKRGLVYSIFAFHSGYSDTGQFGVYAGTGPSDLPELVPVICDELLKISYDITAQDVQRAKTQMKANMLMGRESMMTRADQMAKHMLYRGEALDVDQIVARIDHLSAEQIARMAKMIFSSAPTLAATGPLKQLQSFESIQSRLVS